MESLIVLVSPPSLQLFFLLRLLFSFGPSSNIRDGKLTVQQEEAAEEKALPCARKLAGDNKDKKKSNWGRPLARSVGRRAADGAIANDAITNFARRPGEGETERGEEERARQRATVVECE